VSKRQKLPFASTWGQALEKPEGAIKNGKSRGTGNIGYTRHRVKKKQTNKQANKQTNKQTNKQKNNIALHRKLDW
jgi:hypothetical protein